MEKKIVESLGEITDDKLYNTETLKQNISEETLALLDSVKIKTYGGVGSEISSLTGSATLIQIERIDGSIQKILLDCGLVQGDGMEHLNEALGFDPKEIDAVILSHPHIDHIGRVPMLVKGEEAFDGFVYTTNITHELMRIMLTDSVNIMMKSLRVASQFETKAENLKQYEARLGKLEKIKSRCIGKKTSLAEMSGIIKSIEKLENIGETAYTMAEKLENTKKIIESNKHKDVRVYEEAKKYIESNKHVNVNEYKEINEHIDVLLPLTELLLEGIDGLIKDEKKYAKAIKSLNKIHDGMSWNNGKGKRGNKIKKALGGVLKKLNKLLSIMSGRKKESMKYVTGEQRTIDDLELAIQEVKKDIENERGKDITDIEKQMLDVEEKILFTLKDLVKLNKLVKEILYNDTYQILTGVNLEFINAAHILGSAQSLLTIDDGKGGTYNMGFSGDLGRYSDNNLGVPDTESFPELDFYQIESTYGGVFHADRQAEVKYMAETIRRIAKQNGKIIIPVFMLQRMQDVVVELFRMKEKGLIPKNIPIFYDGGSIDKINSVFIKYDKAQTGGENYGPVLFPGNNVITKVGGKPSNNPFIKTSRPAICLATGGMLAGGAVMKYLPTILQDHRNALFTVGYQAEGTPGRQILDGAGSIITPKGVVDVNSEVHQFRSFSSHLDHSECLMHLDGLKFRPGAKIMVNHGEADGSQAALAKGIDEEKFVDSPAILAEVGDFKVIK